MVILGVSISQSLPLILAALSLLVLSALLWMNHRTPSQPAVVLQLTGVLCPVDRISGLSQDFPLPMPARAPPTFPSLPITQHAREHASDSGALLMMVRPVADSAEKLR